MQSAGTRLEAAAVVSRTQQSNDPTVARSLDQTRSGVWDDGVIISIQAKCTSQHGWIRQFGGQRLPEQH